MDKNKKLTEQECFGIAFENEYKKWREQDKKNNTAPAFIDRLGISENTLYNWRHGYTLPREDKIKEIADFFNVPYGNFLSEERINTLMDELSTNAHQKANQRMMAALRKRGIKKEFFLWLLSREKLEQPLHRLSYKNKTQVFHPNEFSCSAISFTDEDLNFIAGLEKQVARYTEMLINERLIELGVFVKRIITDDDDDKGILL